MHHVKIRGINLELCSRPHRINEKKFVPSYKNSLQLKHLLQCSSDICNLGLKGDMNNSEGQSAVAMYIIKSYGKFISDRSHK